MADANEETRKAPSLTHSQTVNRQREITTELERLGELESPTPEDENYFEELTVEFRSLNDHRRRLERDAKLAEVRSAAKGIGGFRVERGSASSSSDYDRDAILEPDSIEDKRFRNPWDLSEVRTFGRSREELGSEYRSRAESAIEKMQCASDDVREAAMKVLERSDHPGELAEQILVTSSPAYLRGWSKCARGESKLLTAEESRAMSLTTTAGGFLVPFQLDPSVIITSAGSRNEVRQAARVVTATGNVWHGVSSGAVSWSWDTENTEVSDDATTFAQPSIDIESLKAFVPISLEAMDDEQNVAQEVAKLLAFGKDTAESTAFVTGLGSGSNQPTGIVTALDGTASEVAPLTAETFAIGDVYNLDSSLPSRHQVNASWLANRKLYNLIRQFDTAGGAGLWERIGNGQPAELLGQPALNAEAMDATWNVAATADNFILVYGDFQNYVIADRVGTRIEFIPHLFATANNLPNGKRGWFASFRVGAGCVNVDAFRMLNLATTA